MVVLLGSKNPCKYRSVKSAIKELGCEMEIVAFDVPSSVNDRPIGYEIIRGAESRNAELKKIAREKGIAYDYLVSIEGGIELDESGTYYMVSYCAIENREGKKHMGKSLCLALTSTLFEYNKNVGSINRVIERMKNCDNFNQKGGITGFISNGVFDREKIDRDVVMSTFMPFLTEDIIEELEKELRKEL